MGKHCCVLGCTNSYINNSSTKMSFHGIPTKNPDIRKKWIAKIDVPSSKITDSSRVCSAHFKRKDFITSSDNENGLKTRLHPNAVPSIFAPLVNEVQMDEETLSNSAQSDTHLIDDEQERIERLKRKLDVANFELESQKLTNKRLSAENKALNKVLTFDNIKNDSGLIEFYTGFENEAAYSAFLLHIKTRASKNVETKLNGDDVLFTEDSFFLTLIRLKLGFPAAELARIFGISVDSVDRVFTAWISFLNLELRELLPNLAFRNRRKQLPQKKWTESTLMVDCIQIQMSSACGRYNYTAKALVAVTPEGIVRFVSDVERDQSASFRTIVLKSNFLNYLRAGQSLTTDKGSEIANRLPAGVSIHFSAPNLNDIIQKVKSNRILDNCSPSPLSAPTESNPILEGRLSIPLAIWEKSIVVCAMLINFKRGDMAPDNNELE